MYFYLRSLAVLHLIAGLRCRYFDAFLDIIHIKPESVSLLALAESSKRRNPGSDLSKRASKRASKSEHQRTGYTLRTVHTVSIPLSTYYCTTWYRTVQYIHLTVLCCRSTGSRPPPMAGSKLQVVHTGISALLNAGLRSQSMDVCLPALCIAC